LKRLGFSDRVTEYLPVELSLPAIGQGALGIECRLDDQELVSLISFLNDPETQRAVGAERAFLLRCDGGCQVPIAAFGETEGDQLRLTGLISSVDGTRSVRGSRTGPADSFIALGKELADQLLADGGREILREVYQSGLAGEREIPV
jgi:hydroxymethylbilane synthase